MSHGVFKVYTQTITAGATSTAAYDLGRTFAQVYLEVPTMSVYITTATCNVYVQGSADNSTFRRVTHPQINSSTSSVPNDFELGNSVTNRIVPIPNAFRYIKVEMGQVTTTAVAFKVLCSDE